MKTISIKEIKTKSGKVYPAGHEFGIVFHHPTHCALVYPSIDEEKPIRFPALKLHRFFKGFVPVTMEKVERFMEEMESSGVCQSLTGKTVEPDGVDEHGFPSILMALGYV